jgi:hypothetical protein
MRAGCCLCITISEGCVIENRWLDNSQLFGTRTGFMEHIIFHTVFRRCVLTFLIILTVVFSALSSPVSAESLSDKEGSVAWVVETEFGGFEITVSHDFTRVTTLSLWLEKHLCGGITVSGDIHAESRNIWPIVTNQFQTDTNLGIYRIIICGVFDDARSQLWGTWQIRSAGKTCTGEWKSSEHFPRPHTY